MDAHSISFAKRKKCLHDVVVQVDREVDGFEAHQYGHALPHLLGERADMDDPDDMAFWDHVPFIPVLSFLQIDSHVQALRARRYRKIIYDVAHDRVRTIQVSV